MTENPYNTSIWTEPGELSTAYTASISIEKSGDGPTVACPSCMAICALIMPNFTIVLGNGSALANISITRGDTVSVLLPNTPAMLECIYGVPMTGGVLHQHRLDAAVVLFPVGSCPNPCGRCRQRIHALCEALAIAKVQPVVIQVMIPCFRAKDWKPMP